MHGRWLCFPFTNREGGKQTVRLAFPHICMQTFLLHCLILSFLLCLTLSLAVYVSVTHSVTPFFSSLGLCCLCLPLLNHPHFSFTSISSSAVSVPLVLCLRPLIRFGLSAISFGPVCGGVLPCLAEYPEKALRLCRCSRNHVSRA